MISDLGAKWAAPKLAKRIGIPIALIFTRWVSQCTGQSKAQRSRKVKISEPSYVCNRIYMDTGGLERKANRPLPIDVGLTWTVSQDSFLPSKVPNIVD